MNTSTKREAHNGCHLGPLSRLLVPLPFLWGCSSASPGKCSGTHILIKSVPASRKMSKGHSSKVITFNNQKREKVYFAMHNSTRYLFISSCDHILYAVWGHFIKNTIDFNSSSKGNTHLFFPLPTVLKAFVVIKLFLSKRIYSCLQIYSEVFQ